MGLPSRSNSFCFYTCLKCYVRNTMSGMCKIVPLHAAALGEPSTALTAASWSMHGIWSDQAYCSLVAAAALSQHNVLRRFVQPCAALRPVLGSTHTHVVPHLGPYGRSGSGLP